MTSRRRLVRVPASTANLGSGYDVLAAALETYLEVEVEETGTFEILPADGLEVPLDRTNLVVRAFERLHSADGLRFAISSEIPLSAGMGSSAAAIVAGLLAADHLYELALEREEILEHAVELEGHPDNVAAALYGGVVLCAPQDGGGVAVTRMSMPKGVEAVLVTPDEPVATAEARAALPETVTLPDAVINVAAAASLVLGLERGDLSLLRRGMADRLHQPHRRPLYPRSMELVEDAVEMGAIGGCISGAGPSVLLWSWWETTGALMDKVRKRTESWAEVRRISFEPRGADVPEL
ncbi:MAG: homoserine kinase [Solirubrobacterales bacterium]